MAYKIRKFSQVREFEEWMEANGHTIDNATTMVYGCHIIITYKLDAEAMAKAIEGRAKIAAPAAPTVLPARNPQLAVDHVPGAPAAPTSGRAVIQSRATASRG